MIQVLTRNKLKSLAAFSCVAVVLFFILWQVGWVDRAIALKEPVLGWCRDNPLVLFAAIVFLPGFAFPVAPLLILAGVVWGSSLQSCLITLFAVILNICWTHLIASGPLRFRIIRLLGSRFRQWQEMPANDHFRVSCLLRVTPGVPLFIQNYVIGLLGIPLRYSIALAIPITGLYVCGFVLTGGAIFEGKVGLFILGISLLIAVTMIVKIIRSRISLSLATKTH